MASVTDRPNTALLVVDVQNDVVELAHERDRVVGNIASLVAKARAAAVPVVWIQHDDQDLPAESDGWQIVSELDPRPGEPVIRKNFRDSFEATSLDQELAALDVGRLVVTGAQTDFCVRWTLHGALSRGFDTVLVSDAHTTDADSAAGMPSGAELIAHTNSVWASQAVPSATNVIPTADVGF